MASNPWIVDLPRREQLDDSALSDADLHRLIMDSRERIGLRAAAWSALTRRATSTEDFVQRILDLLAMAEPQLYWVAYLQIQSFIVPKPATDPERSYLPEWWSDSDPGQVGRIIAALRRLPLSDFPTSIFLRSFLQDASLCDVAIQLNPEDEHYVDTAMSVATALRKLDTPDSVAARLHIFTTTTVPAVKRYAAFSLIAQNMPSVIQYLEGELQSESGSARVEIACYLAAHGITKGVEVVRALIESDPQAVVDTMSYVSPELGIRSEDELDDKVQKVVAAITSSGVSRS